MSNNTDTGDTVNIAMGETSITVDSQSGTTDEVPTPREALVSFRKEDCVWKRTQSNESFRDQPLTS